MRKFDVLLEHKKKRLLYKDLTGEKAIKLMEELKKRKYETFAFTESQGYVETLTLEEMKESVIF